MLNMFEIRYVRISFGVHDQDEANQGTNATLLELVKAIVRKNGIVVHNKQIKSPKLSNKCIT